LYRHLKRFAPALGPDRLRLMIVVSSERREQLFRRQLNRTRLQRLLESQGVYLPLRDMVTIYRVRRAVPVVRAVIKNKQQLRELRARKLANQGLSDTRQQTRHVIHNKGTHTNTAISNEEGGTSW
jgi:histone acetyltransferase (RNA polymerase elongator complex component)